MANQKLIRYVVNLELCTYYFFQLIGQANTKNNYHDGSIDLVIFLFLHLFVFHAVTPIR